MIKTTDDEDRGAERLVLVTDLLTSAAEELADIPGIDISLLRAMARRTKLELAKYEAVVNS